MTASLKHGSFCTGYGGLDMAAQAVFGGSLAWWSDIDRGPIATMEHHKPDVPNIGDIKTANWAEVAPVDILTAGYPCQPFSNAGKRLGTDDPRHLWPFIADAIRALRPRIIVLENVAAHLRRGFDVVSQELSELGYLFTWDVVRADAVGAPHQRKRLFIVAVNADARSGRWNGRENQELREGERDTTGGGVIATDAASQLQHGGRYVRPFGGAEHSNGCDATPDPAKWGQYAAAVARWESVLGRHAPSPTMAGTRGGQVLSPSFVEWMMGLPEGHVTSVNGLKRSTQLQLLGNGVVPQQAEFAIRELYGRLQ